MDNKDEKKSTLKIENRFSNKKNKIKNNKLIKISSTIEEILIEINNASNMIMVDFLQILLNSNNIWDLEKKLLILKNKIKKRNKMKSSYFLYKVKKEITNLKKIEGKLKLNYLVFRKIVKKSNKFYTYIRSIFDTLPSILKMNYILFNKYSDLIYLENNVKILDEIISLVEIREIYQVINYKQIAIIPRFPILPHELRNILNNIQGNHKICIRSLKEKKALNQTANKSILKTINILSKYNIFYIKMFEENSNYYEKKNDYFQKIKFILDKITNKNSTQFSENIISILRELFEEKIYN